MTENLSDQSVARLLEAIASTEPAPGAGAAGGVALALGIACARKAVALTLRHAADAEDLAALGVYLAGLSDQAIAGGEADARAFRTFIAASDDADARRAACDDLVAIGECLMAIADEARGRLLKIRTDIYPAMTGDVSAALALIAAARTIHAGCVAETRRTVADIPQAAMQP